MQIKELLKKGEMELKNNNIEESNIKVKLLLSNLLRKNKEYFLTHDTENISSEIEERFFCGINRLKEGVPLQYIIQNQEFFGLDFFVNESVLIPQPDTEILVQEIIDIIKKDYINKEIKILDLCTGSGIIGISIKKYFDKEKIKVFASDISKKALEVANINAERNDVQIEFIESDLFSNIKECFDIIVSNPPYIKTNVIKTLSKEVQNEPILALDGGEDGLIFYRNIAEIAKKYLNENGTIAVEIGFDQKEEVCSIFEKNNYKQIYCKKDFGNNNRIVVAKYSK